MRKVVCHKTTAIVLLVSLAIFASIVYSHCQIPCGIYDDPVRFAMIAEHIRTIEKATKQINVLSEQKQPNMNQIVRWIQNKDIHADELSQIVTYYFMAQRVKPVDKADSKVHRKYVKKLTLLHEMLVYSMKAKQTTDLSNVEKLRTLLAEFRVAYSEDSGHKH